jgi:hypothetical protein
VYLDPIDPLDAQNAGLHDEAYELGHEAISLNLGDEDHEHGHEHAGDHPAAEHPAPPASADGHPDDPQAHGH